MKMKRMFAAAWRWRFLHGPGLCAGRNTGNDWYLETASELARCVGELAGDEAYMQMMTSILLISSRPCRADFASVTGPGG